MRRNLEDRDIDWRVIDGLLERSVTLHDGRSYSHRCTKAVFEQVARYIADPLAAGLTMDLIAQAINEPYTQVNVAFELLKERSILETDGRKSFVGAGYREALYEHAMTEYHALADGYPPQFRPAGQNGKEDARGE